MRPNRVVIGAWWSRSGSLLGLLGDLDQGVGEGVQRVLVLGLRRLDHQSLMDDEREVVGRRVEAVVHQPLGYVQGADIAAFEATLGDELVHADAVKGHVIGLAQACQQVVGVEDGVPGDIRQSIGTVHGDVGEGAHHAAAKMAVEGLHPADGFGQA